MEAFNLNKNQIAQSIERLETLKLDTVSDEEIAEIIRPLLSGFSFSAPTLDVGSYIYRGRVCSKPAKRDEIIYPKPEYIKQMGRANQVGEPLFYGSVGKNIPFFELRAKTGDTLVMTVWKTTKPLMLAHMGFTKEVAQLLDTERPLEDIYGFVKETQNINELNTFVYNYLSRLFSKRIDEDTDSSYYRLTNSIAQPLFTEPLCGIIYPTIAMYANAENIVMKHGCFDNNLEIVSIEFLQIVERNGDDMRLETLDTATVIDQDENILWTGKGFAWECMGQQRFSIKRQLDEFIASNEADQRINPISTGELYHNVSKLEKRFRREFENTFKSSKELDLSGNGEQVKPRYSINQDLDTLTSTISFYIPACKYPLHVCLYLIDNIPNYLNDPNVPTVEIRDDKTRDLKASSKDIKFTNQLCIYSENPIHIGQLQDGTPACYQVSTIFASHLEA